MAFYKFYMCFFFQILNKTASALEGLNVTCHCLAHCDKSAYSLSSLSQNTAYVQGSEYVMFTCL